MADVQYTVHLDDDQVLQALRIIDQNIRKVANDGDRAFEQVSKSAKVSGVQIGAVSGIVQELTRRFIDMAAQAARAFIQIAAGGVQLNRELELTRISLINIFEGNEAAADAFIATTDKLATRLRIDFQELRTIAKGILPDVGDAQQTIQLLEQFVILGRDAGQNFTSIRIALEEAVTGQFTSLQRRLNIPLEAIRQIKERAKDIGIPAALLEVLSARVDKLGLSLDDFADSLEAQIGAIKAEGRLLQQTFGEPIFEELKEQAADFLNVLETKGVSIDQAATAFGQLVASVVEFIGTNLNEFLMSLDFEQLEMTADALNGMSEAAKLLVDVLDLFPDMSDELAETRNIIEVITLSLLMAAKAAAQLKATIESTPTIRIAGALISKDPQALIESLGQATREGIFNQEKYNQIIAEADQAFEDYKKRIEENREEIRQRHEAVEETSQADTEAGDAILKHKKALEELTKAEAEAAEAQEKLSKAFGEAATDLERKRTEILIEAGRKRLDDEIKNAEKREDIARKSAEKIEDILREHDQAIDDAARDLTRDEEDIARKAARDRGEVERDSARERVNIETEFRRELERIRDRFNESAAEAERRNDAQAFLEAVRQRDRDVVDARRTRDESLEDAATRAVEQRAKLQEQLQFEIEDAHIANTRKLEDLQLRLGRELEEQRLGYQRQIDEQTLAEARQREQRQREFQQELEDFARKEGQRLQDLQRSLNKEIEMIAKAEQLKRQIRVAEAQATVAQVNAIMSGLFGGGRGAAQESLGNTLPPGPVTFRRPPARQFGGDVEPGRPYIVGEDGPEMFVPDQRGMVVPNAVIGPGMTNISHAYDYSRRMDVGGISVGEDMFSNPVAVRRLENIILGIMARVG